jgi:hypothetical protein
MTKRPTLKVSKTDAAKRQIETAIRLWFFSGDPVAIHTLAAAAHQILHDLGKKRGVSTILRDLPGIRPERKKELRALVSRYENFFKHADRDPDALLEFNPDATELFILDAVFTYENLTQEVSPILSTFKAWMLIREPRYMKKEDRETLIERLSACSTDFTRIPKAEFFTDYQSLLMRLGVA